MTFEGGQMLQDGLAARDFEQQESQEQRRAALRERAKGACTAEQYDSLETLIERCFRIPQFGEYHTEGMYMDTHLEKMVAMVDLLKSGEPIEGIPVEIHLPMKDIARAHEKVLIQYVFLHDIAKADTLKLVKESGKNDFELVSWDEWLAMLPQELQKGDDPVKLRVFLEDSEYQQISYPKHGRAGRKMLEEIPGLNPVLLTAIEKHEIGFQFNQISAKIYHRHFSEMDQLARNMFMTMSFLDTMATIRRGGRPDLHDFLRFVASRKNDEYIEALKEAIKGFSDDVLEHLDPQKMSSSLNKLTKSTDGFSERSFAEVLARFKKDTQKNTFDRAEVASRIDSLQVPLDDVAKKNILDAISLKTGYLDKKHLNQVIDELVALGDLPMRQKGKIYSIFK